MGGQELRGRARRRALLLVRPRPGGDGLEPLLGDPPRRRRLPRLRRAPRGQRRYAPGNGARARGERRQGARVLRGDDEPRGVRARGRAPVQDSVREPLVGRPEAEGALRVEATRGEVGVRQLGFRPRHRAPDEHVRPRRRRGVRDRRGAPHRRPLSAGHEGQDWHGAPRAQHDGGGETFVRLRPPRGGGAVLGFPEEGRRTRREHRPAPPVLQPEGGGDRRRRAPGLRDARALRASFGGSLRRPAAAARPLPAKPLPGPPAASRRGSRRRAGDIISRGDSGP